MRASVLGYNNKQELHIHNHWQALQQYSGHNPHVICNLTIYFSSLDQFKELLHFLTAPKKKYLIHKSFLHYYFAVVVSYTFTAHHHPLLVNSYLAHGSNLTLQSE